MDVKLFLRITALVTLAIGITLIVFPMTVETLFVTNSSPSSDVFIQFLGSSLIGYAYLNWYTAKLSHLEIMVATLIGNLSTLVIATLLSLIALQSGALNQNGFLILLLHVTFALGFGYFALIAKKGSKSST